MPGPDGGPRRPYSNRGLTEGEGGGQVVLEARIDHHHLSLAERWGGGPWRSVQKSPPPPLRLVIWVLFDGQ